MNLFFSSKASSGTVLLIILSMLAMMTLSMALISRHAAYSAMLARKQTLFQSITSLTRTLVGWTLLLVRDNFDELQKKLLKSGGSKIYMLDKWPATSLIFSHDMQAKIILSCKDNAIEIRGCFFDLSSHTQYLTLATALERKVYYNSDQMDNPLYRYYVMHETINP